MAKTVGTKKKAGAGAAAKGFSELERNILLAKGATEAQVKRLLAAGVCRREDFASVGDAATLAELCGVPKDVAGRIMAWALPGSAPAPTSVVVESGDVVNCTHCGKRQPKDYKSGDLCPHCGKQAEPILACFWCSATGPGRFCRSCGATFVAPGELELAIMLKRDGVAKDEIPRRLDGMSPTEKATLWGRVRPPRG